MNKYTTGQRVLFTVRGLDYIGTIAGFVIIGYSVTYTIVGANGSRVDVPEFNIKMVL